MKFIFFLLIITLNVSGPLLSMSINVKFTKNQITKVEIPIDVIVHIMSQPDMKAIYAIIEKQQELNRLQPVYHLDNPDVQWKQQPFFKIQQALFPGFALTQTCRTYFNSAFKDQVAFKLKEILYPIFPPGIIFLLLPNGPQLRFKIGSTKNEDSINTWAIKIFSGCCNREPLNPNVIKSMLFITPTVLEKVAKSAEFESLLKTSSLSYAYNVQSHTHSIYDASNNAIMSCSEEKRFSISSQPFMVNISNIKKYEALYTSLIELCMHNIEKPSVIDDIIYRIVDNKIVSFTLVEEILYHLGFYISDTNDHFENKGLFPDNKSALSQDETKVIFRNYFTVLNILCSFNIVDLSLPAISIDGTIAHKIRDEFITKDYPFDIFSEKALSNVQLHRQNHLNDDRLEKKYFIDSLVEIFLLHIPLLHIPKVDKQIINQSHQNKPHSSVFQNIKSKLLVAAPTTIIILGIIYVVKQLYKG